MKNHHYEYLKRKFKNICYRKRSFENKVYCYHTFTDVRPTDLTWWADFGFMLNGCYINVDWVHPRMAFKDAVRDVAFKQVGHLYKDTHNDTLMNRSVPVYKKLGKSRKKIHVWRTTHKKLNTDGFLLALKLSEDALAQEADFVIKPSVSIEWKKYGKSVSVCAPVEVRSIDDIAKLALIIKRILKHEISVDEAFNHHRYTRLDWLKEFKLKD